MLNEEATRSLIKQKLLLSNQAVSSLVLEADALKDQVTQQATQIKALELQIGAREKLLGLTAKQAQAQVDDYVNNAGFGELNEDIAKLSGAERDLGAARQKLAQITGDYNTKLEALDKFGAKQAYLAGGFAEATNAQADAQEKLGDAAGTEVILDPNAKALAEQRRADLQG